MDCRVVTVPMVHMYLEQIWQYCIVNICIPDLHIIQRTTLHCRYTTCTQHRGRAGADKNTQPKVLGKCISNDTESRQSIACPGQQLTTEPIPFCVINIELYIHMFRVVIYISVSISTVHLCSTHHFLLWHNIIWEPILSHFQNDKIPNGHCSALSSHWITIREFRFQAMLALFHSQ